MNNEIENQIITKVIGKVSDFQPGEMKIIELNHDYKVLVIEENGKFYATSNKCTHYGANLVQGIHGNGRVRCPWHGACFNIKTGDIEDFPGLDSLHTFQVTIEQENIIVHAPLKFLKDGKRTPYMCTREMNDNRIFIIIGGGPSGAVCAETLRQEGFTGRIVMITKEKFFPYDRTKLSKAMNVKVEEIYLRKPEFYSKYNIEILLSKEVIELDANKKYIKLDDGKEMNYDSCLIASGGNPRTVPVPGMELKNIKFLRDPSDSKFIIENVEGKRIVIVGSSFIGMEVASYIASKVKSIIVIGMETVPFERVLGEKIGAALKKLHEKNHVGFRMKRIVKEFRGVDGIVKNVLLDNGEILDADLVIIGAGIIPATQFIKNGLQLDSRDKSIIVDKYLNAADGLYAAGDICRFPFWMHNDGLVRIEHWGVAELHGKIAAKNMLGKQIPIRFVPYFWTTQYGKVIRYCGHVLSFDELYVDGDIDNLKFIGYFIKDNKIVGAVSIGRDPLVSAVAELLHQNRMPYPEEVKQSKIDLIKFASKIE